MKAKLLITAIGVVAFCLLLQHSSTASFGNPFEKAQPENYSCMLTVTRGSKTFPATKMLVFSPGQMRMEGPGEVVTITDRGATLSLNPPLKTATLLGNATTQPSSFVGGDFLVSIKSMAEAEGKSATPKVIGGVTASAFQIDQGVMQGVVYVDPKSDLPLEFELINSQRHETSVYSDFHFNLSLDPALFSMTPPAGYQLVVNTLPTNSNDLGENLIPVLRAYAERSGGTFPPQVDDSLDLIKVIFDQAHPSTNSTQMNTKMSPNTLQLASNIGTADSQLGILKRGTQWDYLPNAAKLGDAAKIVFWYQPKDSPDFKAIFGDLHGETVTKDRLPAPPGE